MSTITKEWLQQTIAEYEANRDELPFGLDTNSSIELQAFKLALASLEAEPVGEVSEQRDGLVMDGTVDLGGASTHRIIKGASKMKRLPLGTKFYTAPPAPVSVPDAMEMDDDFDSAFEHGKAVGWNAYRAAMLHGAEPVTTAYKLPFDQWLSQQTGTIDVECGCVMTEVFFHWLRVAYEAGNSPVIPDCSCRTCRPVIFSDSRFVVCPECGNKRCPHANDHRNAYSGSNEPGQEGSAYPAAPQQEA
ncbi:hypothetical protein [Enterobacter asburiae]|uniref:hypothetical protein n=1 Tax=Enterobacter asburiae TaxID=61645 RepID=UPI0034D3337F